MASIMTKEMWERVKRYFRDGHVPGSAPLGFNMHICKMDELSTSSKATSTGINGSAYGVEIKESLMPLFSVWDTASPNCTCFDVTNIIKHIEEYLTTAPDNHPNDFTITSWKNDIDVEDANLYAMRDAVCWWTHWTGALRPEDHWKQMYVVFSTIPDDVQIPPSSIVDGSYRCLGHTWADCKQGLIEEGVPPTWVELAEMCLWREALIQYFEKIDPKVYCLLKANTTLMTQHRTFTANTLGCAVMVLASEGKDSREAGRFALEAAGIADCLSMDIAKESLGILQGEKTETVAGDRAQLKRELRWIYIRCMEYLKAQPNAHILRRFGSGGLHFVPMMDRYLERVRSNIRFPITDAQARKLEPFINRAYIREGLNPNGLLQQAEKERVKGNQ